MCGKENISIMGDQSPKRKFSCFKKFPNIFGLKKDYVPDPRKKLESIEKKIIEIAFVYHFKNAN